MLRYALMVPPMVLAALGGDGLYRAAANRQQTVVDCRTYAADPSAMWVRVTGCEIDVAGAGYRERNGDIQELYFPARPAGSGQSAAPIVVAIRHPSALALANKSMGSGRQPDPAEYLAAMQSVIAALRANERIDGCARKTVVDRFRARGVLAGLNASTSAVVIDLHGEPAWTGPVLLGAAGIVFAVGAFIATRPTPARGSGGTRVSHPPRRRLMLLNLGPDAGLDAIETAPPLGARTNIVNGITTAIPDAVFDVNGQAATTGENGIVIDVGPGALVHTATVVVHGPAGGAQLRVLLETTGWRAFEPSTGAFVDDVVQ